ncbi:MAG: hypothetical protein N2561_06310 [Bacteroidetes bacterium]|nr:hypothetical protein [Rhodothermia bacterium]MCS7154710.1 hypothetical protein [Bacteroidota bacterium]MCX7907133.1 hypothetical protein [Bacteroidota bacterium]MDW8137503.1 hypothetical protein [Bacteroidota bacterium]MDW8285543.1 hypothetical protein [Bacteroidota bacterium]
MRTSCFLTLLALSLSPLQAQAQDPELLAPIERLEQMHRRFLQNRLALPPERAQVFWALYQQYTRELNDLRQERIRLNRQLRRERDFGTDETRLAELALQVATFEGRIAELKRRYYERFRELLGPRGLAALVISEQDFLLELDRLRRARSRF